jgi:replicative DNA helicase
MTSEIHYSKDLENAVIGACLLEKDAVGRIYDLIKPEMFYITDNQKIFNVIIQLYTENIPIDMLTVWHHLRNVTLDENNGAWTLCQRTMAVVSTAHLEYHAYIVRTLWQQRELEKITRSGVKGDKNAKENISDINSRLMQILGNDVKKDWYTMTDLMYELTVHQDEIASGKKQSITTGIKSIDRINGGFAEGDMVIIGARPAVGKSAFLTKIATEISLKGKKVGIISLEMNNSQIAARMASYDTDIDFRTIYNNLFQDENQKDRFNRIISANTSQHQIFVSDKTKVDITDIKAKAQKLKNSHGCDCMMIDYLQLVSSEDSKSSNREQEVAKISRGIKLMALEMKIPFIVLVQLNRDVTKRSAKDRYPKLSDIRESGSLEQDADVVLMLHRDWTIGLTENEDGTSTEFEADLLGVKWRNGQPFHLKLDFEPTTMKFKERSSWLPVSKPPDNE